MQIQTRFSRIFIGLMGVALLPGACSGRRHPVAVELEALTGCHTRVVWCQDWDKATDLYADRPKFKLMGFDSRDNRGEHWILKDVGNYARPMITAKGTHIVYSDRQARKVFVVDWKGKRCRELVEGFAFDTLLDPETGVEWVYYGSEPVPEPHRQDIKAYEALMRIPLDGSLPPELVWNKTMLTQLSEHNLQISSDGKHASLITPVGLGVASLPNGEFQTIGAGCWPSIAPGPDFLFWHFNGGHRTLAIYERDGANRRDMPINDAPGINGMEVFHPRWSNHPRFMGMDGPLAISGGGAEVEVYVGRFNATWTAIEAWVKVTDNTNADFFVDVWVESGTALAAPTSEVPVAVDATSPPVWPPQDDGLVFVWLDKSPGSGMLRPSVDAAYMHTAKPRGLAHYGPNLRMELHGGSFLATPVNGILPAAFKDGRGFTIEAVITPAGEQSEATASIIELTGAGGSGDLALEQSGDALNLRLRKTVGDVVIPVVRVRAGEPLHLALSSDGKNVNIFVNGAQTSALPVNDVEFSSWSAHSIVFGAALDGSRDWRGSLEGIAIYGRALAPDEVGASMKLLDNLRQPRPAIKTVNVKARLVARSEIPQPKAILPYRRSLAVNVFDVTDSLDSGVGTTRLNVAQWVIMDSRVTSASDRKPGETYELKLAEFDLHKQLKRERISRDAEDFDAPLYYDVNSAWQ